MAGMWYIEGNPLNKRQVEKALAGQMNSWEKAVIGVQNYKKSLDWLNKRVKNKKEIILKDIFKLHSLVAKQLLPEHKVGQIRPGPIYVVDIIGKKEIVKYAGPESAEVGGLIRDLLMWLKPMLSREKQT